MQAASGYLMFRIKPKLHMFMELPFQNTGCDGYGDCEWGLNPINASTWSDEDFIGKCSRLSRSCGGAPLSQAIRCIQKILGRYKLQFNRLQS